MQDLLQAWIEADAVYQAAKAKIDEQIKEIEADLCIASLKTEAKIRRDKVDAAALELYQSDDVSTRDVDGSKVQIATIATLDVYDERAAIGRIIQMGLTHLLKLGPDFKGFVKGKGFAMTTIPGYAWDEQLSVRITKPKKVAPK